jgi:hypothetical protein
VGARQARRERAERAHARDAHRGAPPVARQSRIGGYGACNRERRIAGDAAPSWTRLGEHERNEPMGKIDDACKGVVDNTDGGVACGVVDLDTGMLLGIHNSATYTQTLNEIVAAATMDLFRGSNVGRVEEMVRKHRGVAEDGEHYFQEIHITSKHNYHFAKTIAGGKAVIMLVTKKTTNIGMGWAQLKSAIPSVEPHVP